MRANVKFVEHRRQLFSETDVARNLRAADELMKQRAEALKLKAQAERELFDLDRKLRRVNERLQKRD